MENLAFRRENFGSSENISEMPFSVSKTVSMINFAEGETEHVQNFQPKSKTEASGISICGIPKVRKMYLAAFTALLWAVAMGFATGYSAPATYDMNTDKKSSVKPTKDQETWIGSTLALGAMLGSIVAGPLADKFGRKTTLIFNIVPFYAGWVFISLANDVLFIIIGRFASGISCGIISVIVPMYCVEISTPEIRGLLGSAFQGFLVIGNLLSVIIGSVVSWVYLAVIASGVSVLALVCFVPMSRSPRWLLAKGKTEEAILAMDDLQGGFVDAAAECNEISISLKNEPKGKISLIELRQAKVYKPALISVALMIFQQASGSNAVLFYSSNIFDTSKHFLDPKKSTIILGAVQVVATLMSNFIVDKAGRRKLLLLSALFMAITLSILGAYYYISQTDKVFEEQYSWITLVCLNLFVVSFSIGYGSIPWLLVAEMVPVRARSTASGLASFTNGLFAFIITKTFSISQIYIGTDGTFWAYSVVSLVGFFFVAFVLPETKGKKLEEIEKIFDNSKCEIKDSRQVKV